MDVALRGLGEYPGYYCYDCNRPSWLPYWIDDITEESCNLSISNIVADITSCVAGSADCGAPPNPNPAICGPGVGGPPLAAGNSTADVAPIATTTIPQAIGQAAGSIVGGVASGVASGFDFSAYTLPLIAIALVIYMVKK
jgi:hypothetical protein